MKYIRTKNNIIFNFLDNAPLSWQTLGVEPIKEADDIEELFDRYVVRRRVMDEPCHYIYLSKEQMKADISLRNSAYEIYGAIWITGDNDEPILKSVAKMNENKVFELLI